jgi:hypothetical protein
MQAASSVLDGPATPGVIGVIGVISFVGVIGSNFTDEMDPNSRVTNTHFENHTGS